MGIWDDYDDIMNIKYPNRGPRGLSLKYFRQKGRMNNSKDLPTGGRSPSPNSMSASSIDTRQNVVFTAFRFKDKSSSFHAEKVAYALNSEKSIDGVENNIGNISRDKFLSEIGDKSWRFIISPERADLDNVKLAKDFMNKVCTLSGYDLRWVGGIHRDTAHPHIHIYIDGVDNNGEEVKFHRHHIKHKFRNDLRTIATQQVGARTMEEINIELDRSVTQNRLTGLDRIIENYIDKSGSIDVLSLSKFLETDMYKRITKRLDHLSTLGICERNASINTIEKNWKETLLSLGRYNTFLEGRQSLKYTSPYNYSQYKGGAAIGGIVSKIYTANKDSWHDAFVVETPDGKGYYVPVAVNKYNLKEGDLIRVYSDTKEKGRLDPDINKKTVSQISAMYKDSLKVDIFHKGATAADSFGPDVSD